jgi:hypothetical protein
VRGRAAALAALAALALTACGGSDESGEDATGPTTVPTTTTPTTPTTPAAPSPPPEPGGTPYSTEEQAPGEGDGSASPPLRGDGETGGVRPPVDSPENDTAPDPDSPAGRYERYCDENPGACD